MTAQEYFDRDKDKIIAATVDELNDIIFNIYRTMAGEVYDTCVKNKHEETKYVCDMLKAQNCKWNEFIDIFHKNFNFYDVLIRDGFIQWVAKKMPEYALELLKGD